MKAAFGLLGMLIVLAILAVQIYAFWDNHKTLATQYGDVNTKLQKVTEEQRGLQAELNYLSNPKNLEKELRSLFNYHEPGEKMIIVVPSSESSTNP